MQIDQSVIDRLLREQEEQRGEGVQVGVKAGAKWAREAHYCDLCEVYRAAIHSHTDALERLRNGTCNSIRDLKDNGFADLLGGTPSGAAANGFFAAVVEFCKAAEKFGIKFT
jgi:hypothetical protein